MKTILITAASVLALTAAAGAQAQPVAADTTTLDTLYVTTPLRRASSLERSTSSVTVIGEDEIRSSASRDLPALLKHYAGVSISTNGGMGSFYRSQHELVFVFKAGSAPHINNVELGRHGRNRTNIWSYPGVNSFGGQREDLALHPTVKPVALVADAMRDGSHRGGIVLDAFAGSGSTLIAAEQTGRRGRAIELDPLYCDVIVRRMKAVCGIDAWLESSGETFEEVATARRTADMPEAAE